MGVWVWARVRARFVAPAGVRGIVMGEAWMRIS